MSEKIAEEYVNKIVQNIKDSQEVFEGWNKAMQIIFTDLKIGYWIKIDKTGAIEKLEKGIKDQKESDLVLNVDVNTFKGVLDKTISPTSALGSGKLSLSKGSMAEAVKLSTAF